MNVPRPHKTAPTFFFVLALVLAAVITGCAVNQATGKRQLDLVGERGEIELGREADAGISAEMGLYEDPTLAAKIEGVGRELARVSERPELPWSIKIVDDPTVNAFALPGGFLYTTRGILAHFQSEAELAAVLGHEVGHVTARHGVERMSKAQLANVGFGVAMIASEDFRQYGQVAQIGMQLLFLKFSRDDERQSDELGLRYMSRAGWATAEMPKVFDTLDRLSGGAGRVPEWAATHPSPDRRAERIRQQITELPADQRGDRVERNSYLRALDNMVFGEDPNQGYTIGQTYYHPGMAFRLDAPQGWKIINERSRVLMVSPNQDAIVQLALVAAATPDQAAREFFSQQGLERGSAWRPGYASFRTTPDPQSGRYIQGVAGFLRHQDRVVQILGYSRDDNWAARRDLVAGGAGSFRRLEDRYLDVAPARIDIVTVSAPTTLAALARTRGAATDTRQLAILNGVDENTTLAAGTLVKLIQPAKIPG